jgi:predicted Zn-dependent peptidase
MNQFKIDGLTLITDYMPHIETVSVKIMVKVGSRFETIDVSGISHFIEHMAFKGTKTRSKTRIAEEIDITGGSFNAYTSKERTVYYAKVMKNDLDFVLELLADILQNSVFAEEEIENERKVILEERSQIKDSPDDYVFDLFQERLFLDQSLGRPIVGSESFIRSANRKQLLDYIGNYYNRENIIVSCSGNFDEDLFHKMVEQKFSFLQHGNENVFDKVK